MIPKDADHPRMAPQLLVSLAAALAVVTGGMVLAGWAFDIAALKSVLPGWFPMKANAALCFILIGIALLATCAPAGSRQQRLLLRFRISQPCALLAGVISLLTLAEYIFDWDLGIDQWLFREAAGTVGTSHPGRMVPDAALSFVLLAVALGITSVSRRNQWRMLAAVILGMLVTTIALLALLVYVVSDPGAYRWFGYSIMAIHAALLLAILGMAVIASSWQPELLSWSLSRRTTTAFACGVALLAFISFITSRSQFWAITTKHQQEYSEQVIRDLASVLAKVADAQIDTLDFVITGDELFLKSFLSADIRARAALAALRLRVAGSPAQQPQFDRLEAQVQEGLQWFRQVTDTRRSDPAAVQPDKIRHAKDLLDAIHATVEQIGNGQLQAIEYSKQELTAVVRFTDTVTVVGALLSMIIFLSALLALNHEAAERKLAEEEIRRLNANLEVRVKERTTELEASNQALAQFAYVASHDLQEPLRMVVGYVQLLEKRLADKLDADTREFMGYAVDGALRMQNLIQDILAYSRVTTGGVALARLDSAAVLDEALKLLASRIAETGAEVTAQALPVVMADRAQLVQLFQNLIGNAIKFCKDCAPRVRVQAVREAGWWRFSIIDNGIGIAPEFRGQLFVIFKRLHTRREFPGTGIGLAICKRIVERHGGQIGIDAAPGGGSVFWFTLPEEKST